MKTLLNDPYFWVVLVLMIVIGYLAFLGIKGMIEERLFSNQTEIEQNEPKVN